MEYVSSMATGESFCFAIALLASRNSGACCDAVRFRPCKSDGRRNVITTIAANIDFEMGPILAVLLFIFTVFFLFLFVL